MNPRDTPQVPPTPPSQWPVVGLAAIGPFSLNIFQPCLPWIRADLGAPIELVQLTLSASILVAAIATAAAGPIADELGRRPVALISVYAYVLSCIVGLLAPTIEVLIAARVVQAASSSMALTVARALAHDRQQQVERTIARVTFVAVVMVLVAPVVGGLLIDHIGWRAVFALTAGLGLVMLFAVHHRLSATGRRPRDATRRLEPRPSVIRLLRSPVFIGYAGQASLHFAMFFAYTSSATYLLVDTMGRSASEYGMWFLLLAMVVLAALALAPTVSARIGSGPTAGLGSLLVLAGALLSAWLLRSNAPLTSMALVLPAVPFAFGVGLALPSTNVGVMSAVPKLAGTASGLLGFVQFAAAAAFAQLAVRNESNPAAVLVELMLVGGLGSAGFGLLTWRHRSTPCSSLPRRRPERRDQPLSPVLGPVASSAQSSK